MKLGTVEIGNVVKDEIVIKPDLTRRKLIQHLEKDAFENEKEAIQQMKVLEYAADEKLRELDIGFLNMSKPFKGKIFKAVPAFAVYKYKDNAFLSCRANYNEEVEWSQVNKVFQNNLTQALTLQDGTKPKAKSPPPFQETNTGIFSLSAFASFGLGNGYALESTYLGLIPASVKQKIRKAVGKFEEIDLIAEASWQEKKILAEPLIVGVWQNRTFLIDQFDTTKMEKYILAEFLT